MENRCFHPNNSTLKNRGVYENNLIFLSGTNYYKVNGENEPILLTGASGHTIEDNYIPVNSHFAEFELIDNSISVVNELIVDGVDIAKDNEGSYYYSNSEGKVFAYDESGNHTELYDCEEGYLFNGLPVDNDYIIISRYNSSWDVIITKIPKTSGENIEHNFGQVAWWVNEIITVTRLNQTKEVFF